MKIHWLSLWRLLALLRPYWRLALLNVFLVTVGAVTEGVGFVGIVALLDLDGVVQVAGLANVFDQSLVSSLAPGQRAQVAAFVLIAIGVLRAGTFFGAGWLTFLIPAKVERDMRLGLANRLLHADYDAVGGVTMGEVQDGLGTHVTSAGLAVQTLLQLVAQALIFLVYAAALAFVSPTYSLISLAFLIVTGVCIRGLILPRIRTAIESENESRKLALSRAAELLRGHDVVRSFGRESWFVDRFSGEVHQLADMRGRGGMLRSAMLPVAQMAAIFLAATILLVGSLTHEVADSTWVGAAGLFVLLLLRLMLPASTAINLLGNLTIRTPSVFVLDRLSKRLEGDGSRSQSDDAPEQHLDSLKSIELCNVSAGYGEEQVLRNVSLTIQRGQYVAITGASGSGKSTLARLISGMLLPTEGEVRVAGRPINIASSNWRQQFSVVGQHPFLFPGTIADNLRFASPDAGSEQLKRVLKRAEATFVESLPDGLETEIGDVRSGISGGQLQRLAIARALLAERQVIVLDEPTSALDTGTEESLAKTIEQLTPDYTVIVIAHRMQTIQNADVKIHMNAGEVECIDG